MLTVLIQPKALVNFQIYIYAHHSASLTVRVQLVKPRKHQFKGNEEIISSAAFIYPVSLPVERLHATSD